MRKLLVLGVILILVIFMSGCKMSETKSLIKGKVAEEEEKEEEKSAQEEVEEESEDEGESDEGEEETEGEEEEEVSESNLLPDLDLTNLFWETKFPTINEEDILNIKVKNDGAADIDSFTYAIEWYKDDEFWKEESFVYNDALKAGDSIKIEEEFSFSSTKTYKAKVYLDEGNEIKENDEFNNLLVAEVTPRLPTTGDDDDEDEDDNGGSSSSSGTCIDTDGGKDFDVKGTCSDQEEYQAGFDDICISSSLLWEMYCDNGECKKYEKSCSCAGGACT